MYLPVSLPCACVFNLCVCVQFVCVNLSLDISTISVTFSELAAAAQREKMSQ